jgi:hypothetical protein
MSFTQNQKRKRRQRAWQGHVAGIVATGAMPRPVAREIFPIVAADSPVMTVRDVANVAGVHANADGTVTLPAPPVVRWDDATLDPLDEIKAEVGRQRMELRP